MISMTITESEFDEIISNLYDECVCKSNSILDVGVGLSSLNYNDNNWLEDNKKCIIKKIELILTNPNSRISDINCDNLDSIFEKKSSKIRKRFHKYDISKLESRWRNEMIGKFDRMYFVNVMKSHNSSDKTNISNSFPFHEFDSILKKLFKPIKDGGKIHILNNTKYFILESPISNVDLIKITINTVLNDDNLCLRNGYINYDDFVEKLKNKSETEIPGIIKKFKH